MGYGVAVIGCVERLRHDPFLSRVVWKFLNSTSQWVLCVSLRRCQGHRQRSRTTRPFTRPLSARRSARLLPLWSPKPLACLLTTVMYHHVGWTGKERWIVGDTIDRCLRLNEECFVHTEIYLFCGKMQLWTKWDFEILIFNSYKNWNCRNWSTRQRETVSK